MDQEQDLDLLDLEDDTSSVDALPEAAPFTSPRPKKPWLLMGLGVAIIVLATWIIIARVGGDSGTTVNIDLNEPVQNVDNVPAPVADLNVPAKPVEVAPETKPVPKVEAKPQPVPAETKPVEENGTPVRVISDRKNVTFNPDKPTTAKPAAKPATKPTIKPAAKVAPKQTATASAGSIYVQFGSYGTRAAAQSAEQKLRAAHSNLFSGKQFVILAAQVNGKTTYRLRVAFQNANDANGFCRNAKSDGLDCYVTK
ncbi:MAG: SPOR domain-containing protein [Alphaproteobacteria bacterium]|nr:SPOR domain-containing protein [Alphaproteobacteria bacterium]